MSRLRHLVFGTPDRIAGTVYGTIVVMAAIAAAASHGEPDAAVLAGTVATTVLVFWVAHVYSHALAETIALDRKLDRAEIMSIARRELAIPLAAVVPVAVLVLGALGVFRDSTAAWIAMLFGLATLALQGFRYAGVERLSGLGAAVSVAVNVGLGLVIIGLKAGLGH